MTEYPHTLSYLCILPTALPATTTSHRFRRKPIFIGLYNIRLGIPCIVYTSSLNKAQLRSSYISPASTWRLFDRGVQLRRRIQGGSLGTKPHADTGTESRKSPNQLSLSSVSFLYHTMHTHTLLFSITSKITYNVVRYQWLIPIPNINGIFFFFC